MISLRLGPRMLTCFLQGIELRWECGAEAVLAGRMLIEGSVELKERRSPMDRETCLPIASAKELHHELSTSPSRREFIAGVGSAAVLKALGGAKASAEESGTALNIARVAVPRSRVIESENRISALNDGFAPGSSFDRSHPVYAFWSPGESDERATWVEYEWSEPVDINRVEVYWAVDRPRPAGI